MSNTFIKDIYENEKEKIYFSYNIIDYNTFHKYEEELIQLNNYLPNIIRQNLNYDYYKFIINTGAWSKILTQINSTRNYSMEESVEELLDWIKKYPQFKNIINDDELNKLNKDLKQLNEKFLLE